VLSDPFLKMKYTKGKCNIPSGRFERMYKNELNGHTLRKTLTLIIFLDGAKRNNVLPSSIRLFRKNGVIKSSKEFLHILCRDYIHGIGNLNKHLHQLGVSVSFEQSPLEELDFFVTNLATDLRDGVRLGKLAEALGNSSGVIEQMRIPAISRLQKVFNVGVALSALSDLGVPNVDQIHPNYIVDGHRPQVLKILWSITSSLELNNQLDKEKLREEIYNIRRSHNTLDGPVEFSSLCGDIESCQDICDLLLVWCDTVCSFYNLNVTNFSSSFADGRAVCFLIHYYHPGILNFSDILQTHLSLQNDVALLDDGKREQLFRNERNNCSLACQKIIEIGGIPNMLPISDTSNSPDERTIILCVGYLCKRLLESSKESSAISVIQNAVRLYLNRSKMGLKRNAVNVIERAWIAYRSLYFKRQRELYTKPVRIIEAFFIARRSVFERNSRQRFCAIQLQVSRTNLWKDVNFAHHV
jgi:abnormal spindle-like microcephaly-associated protein